MTYLDLDLGKDTNILNIKCLGMTVLLCNKQHVNNI